MNGGNKDEQRRPDGAGPRGERADAPAQIPPRGWWQVLRRGVKAAQADNVPILAGGVAFFGFLALFPTIIAALTLYGLIADPAQVAQQTSQFASALPQSAQSLLTDQLAASASAGGAALTVGLAVSLLVALWSASGGVSNLMTAVNIAYDEEDERGFVKLRAIALALTLALIVVALVALALVAVFPPVIANLQLGVVGNVFAQVGRWVLLVGVFLVALAVIYRVAPDRSTPRWQWVSPGAVIATVLWIIVSVGFSFYVSNFGNYSATYGAIAGVVVLMLWLFLTSYLVLLGAEINAESERQTVRDTTTGRPQPRGERGAHSADTQAAEAREAAQAEGTGRERASHRR
ncbi:membrane protein [Prauserella shujinwangii]|uniref:Membrane protein n=1 Tax=Prauserella shujinwangii TaxID=1453103 RepID=A0A2T0LL69_9PSEU|nr:YihY/virulence factor BrkB family protein [Prauserella shujinwangii]PRX43634.1 membrane protein [Prauserella shujinwangii]